MSKKRDFDVATDEMRFEIVKHLTDRNKELRAQLTEKDKIIEGLQEYRKEVEKNIKAEVDERCSDIIKDYEIKLEEKDKEIERLDSICSDLFNTRETEYEKVKNIRKQVCDEIKERIENDFEYDCEYTYGKLSEILDQVEKGEK